MLKFNSSFLPASVRYHLDDTSLFVFLQPSTFDAILEEECSESKGIDGFLNLATHTSIQPDVKTKLLLYNSYSNNYGDRKNMYGRIEDDDMSELWNAFAEGRRFRKEC